MQPKIFFFHYIRKYSNSLPYFHFLHQNNFLKIIKKNYKRLIKIDDDTSDIFNKNKILLTFDDGLKDHLKISEILNKKK